ncbi:MAG: hypothetical protein ACTS10_20840 [Kiloniellales bacterium]
MRVRRLAGQCGKLVVMVRRAMAPKQTALAVALWIVVGMTVVMVMVMTVRSDLRCYRCGSRLRRGTMGQDDDERCNNQR